MNVKAKRNVTPYFLSSRKVKSDIIIVVEIIDVDGGHVKVVVDAPDEVLVLREELAGQDAP